MKKLFLTVAILFCVTHAAIFAQGSDCATASPFCTAAGTATFPASQNTTAPVGPNYDCLGTQPNPAWYYLQVATSGNIVLDMTNSANVDIDFIIWGPFTSSSAACSSGLTGAAVDCSYSASSNETGNINAAVVGEVYVLLITNYSNQATNISLAQTGGTGATNCNIVCSIDSLITTPGLCSSPANLYDLSGRVEYNSPPATGTLTISNSCNSITQVFNAPFDPDSVTYTLTGMPADGSPCTVTAVFSNDPVCTMTKTFTAPPACFVDCPIIVDSAHTCDGVPATLTATGATSYLWSTGATTASILASGVPATYTVIGTTGTCLDTAIAVVTTFPPPTVSFTGDTLTGCNQLLVDFTADTTGNAGATYSWKFGEGGATATGMTSSHFYPQPGCYTVELTASFGPGCATTDSIACMVDVLPPPEASFSVSPDEIDAIASTAYFSNTSVGSTLWIWNFGDSAISTLQHPEHTYDSVGAYPVTLYAFNSDGCIDSVTSTVIVKDIVTFYVPNAFTPNKNDINEMFHMYSYGILPEGYEMRIFDRWGKEVFKTTDIKEGWNGSVNNTGAILTPDTYAYRISYKEATGKRKSVVGHVTLVR
jgi:gliding motility-associated-like protein